MHGGEDETRAHAGRENQGEVRRALQMAGEMKRLSIIIPTLNEAEGIVATLESLTELRCRGHEVIVVDGGSSDGTADLALGLADCVLAASPGRAGQMNAGARAAAGDVLLFLHADSRLPDAADNLVAQGLAAGASVWGRFDARIATMHPMLRVVETMMNLRSRLTHICTGDQGIFVCREAFEAIGGYPNQALMEDIAISARLRRVSAPLCLRQMCTTSARRWENRGVLRTIVLMCWLRLQYALGVAPARLARAYEAGGH
jgi:rSAM/selenodomain-associated transferase 2